MRKVLVIAALLLAPAAGAQENLRREAAPDFDMVSLQAQASREVPNDQVVAVLAVEIQGNDAAALAETANRRMAEALKAAAAFPSVKLRTGNYQTTPRYRNQRIDLWQVSQELRLESSDFVAATRLVATLQQNLVVRGMSVRLSPEARRTAENALIAEALEAFRARADLVRKSMQAASYRIRNLDINTAEGMPPHSAVMAMRAQAAQESVAAEAGISQVTVTVAGAIQLR